MKDSSVQNFLDWVYENVDESSKASLDTLDINTQNSDGTLRGVVTVIPVLKGDKPFLTIPRKMLITDQMGKETEWGKKVQQYSDTSIPDNAFLTLYVLSTLDDPGNFHRPYYNIFPVNIGNIPLWTPVWKGDGQLLDDLIGTELYQLIKNRSNVLKKEYELVKECLGVDFYTNYDYYDYLYIRLLVGSRNFFATIDGEDTSILIPLVDMLNHDLPRQTKWEYTDEAQGVSLKAEVDLSGNTEIYDSYGLKENNSYLLDYGFIMEDNRQVLNMACVKVQLEDTTVTLHPNMIIPVNTAHALLQVCEEKLKTYKYPLDVVVERFNKARKYTNRRNVYFTVKTEQEIIHKIMERVHERHYIY